MPAALLCVLEATELVAMLCCMASKPECSLSGSLKVYVLIEICEWHLTSRERGA